jgi:hypothetical protein
MLLQGGDVVDHRGLELRAMFARRDLGPKSLVWVSVLACCLHLSWKYREGVVLLERQ